MKSKIPFSIKRVKTQLKHSPFPFSRDRKKILDPTNRGKSNDIAHGSIIQVSAAQRKLVNCQSQPEGGRKREGSETNSGTKVLVILPIRTKKIDKSQPSYYHIKPRRVQL